MSIELAREVFGHLCHQEPARAWVVSGEALCMCARCTGVYAGAALAALALPVARFRPGPGVLWVHGIAMLQMAFFGFHFVEHPAWLRTLSGSLFSAGAVYFLWLPLRSAAWGQGKGRPWGYFALAISAQGLLQILVRMNMSGMAGLIEALALAGIAVFVLLSLSSLAALAAGVAGRRKQA